MYTITTLRHLVPTTTTSAKALPFNSFMQLYKCIHYRFAMFIRIIGSWKAHPNCRANGTSWMNQVSTCTRILIRSFANFEEVKVIGQLLS
uniref:Uncharacterized protein n=1 Tax=Strigamia maritima TaxID=126957 RepID=T1JL14_STRMM